eukprot:ANDGO_00450.mRNA.1 DNA-directed RNA polymerase II subunit rpb11
MTNRPDPAIMLLDLPDEIKLEYREEKGIRNAAAIKIIKEDHTFAHLIRCALLQDMDVIFAGYRVPHPLEYVIEINVRTTDRTNPRDAFLKALDKVQRDVTNLAQNFDEEVTRRSSSFSLLGTRQFM